MVTATYDEISIPGDQVKLNKEGGAAGEKETLTERLTSIKEGASAILGKSTDTAENKTVYGAFAAAAAAQRSADNAASAITKLTSDGAVATETQTNGQFGVLTQVKQTNGAISKGAEVMLHKVAASGKINDLDQEIGANDKPVWIVFDCGSATEVM